MTEQTNYMKYRGKCKEMSEALVKENPELRLVRGWYDCPIMGREGHWWCEDKNGTIIDPTKLQFPSAGLGDYIEFDGWCDCDQCGARFHEKTPGAMFQGRYMLCSPECFGDMVGIPVNTTFKTNVVEEDLEDYEGPF